MDHRFHERHPADFQVRVTSVDDPDVSASGKIVDISESGLAARLPLRFTPGSAVRLSVDDSVLFGFVAHATPEQSSFRIGIEVVQALIGESALAQLLRATLEEVTPAVEWLETLP